MPPRPSSSLSSIILLPPTSLLYLSPPFSLPPLRNLCSAPEKSKEEKGNTTRVVRTAPSNHYTWTSRLQKQHPLYLFSLLLYIPYIILTPNVDLSERQNWECLRRGAFALVFDTLFLSKRKDCTLARSFPFFVCILNCHCLSALSANHLRYAQPYRSRGLRKVTFFILQLRLFRRNMRAEVGVAI